MKRKEIPWGTTAYFDLYGSPLVEERDEPSELELTVRDFIDQLQPELQEVYHLRYGERLPLRAVAARMGFKSPWPIQERLAEIERLLREHLNERS